jgi:glutamate carboxypeptidase
MDYKKVADFFDSRKEEILKAIHDLVEIESPSFDHVGNSAVVDFLVKKVENLSCVRKVEIIETENGKHLIINAFEAPKKVLLLGHTDTVHPRGSKLKNPTRIEDNKFYGCGIFDMKANCILMTEVLLAFEELKILPSYSVTILFSCDEEVGSVTGREIVEREALDSAFCLVFEPSANGMAKTGRKGTANYIIKAHGIPAHAGLEPEKGASAILELARQIEKIHLFNSGQVSAIVCQIKGGTAANVVPAEAECTVDVRFANLNQAIEIDRAIKSLEPFDKRVSLKVNGGINRPPLERNEKVLALYKHAKKLAENLGYELGETQVGGASDGNFVASLGIPVLDGLGIKGNGAHTLEEYICIEDITKRATLLFALLRERVRV